MSEARPSWPHQECDAQADSMSREIERLTADRDSWKRMYDIAKARADAAEAKLSGHYRVDL